MNRPRKRQYVPSSDALEPRCLLSGTPVAVWVGQDGHDLAGGATPLAGNGIQDVHIRLSGLPSDSPVSTIQMLGYGRGEWDLNVAAYSQYGGVLVQAPGASTADYYVDAYENETGRSFTLTITYADRTSSVITMNGGTADTNLHMPSATVSALWIGQDGPDRTGPGVGVGPDGFQDVHLSLGHLYAATPVSGVTVTNALGDAWGSGTNPGALARAEFVPNATDASQGDLYFSPTRDLNGQNLSVTVTYADGKLDHTTLTAGHTDPNLAATAPAPVSLSWNTVNARWLGQDGLNLTGQGDVHLTLDAFPAGRTVVTAVLSDQSGVDWSYSRPGSNASAADPSSMALGFQTGSNPGHADLTFQPVVDENGSTLTLLVTLDDGTVLATHLAGGSSDPGLRVPGIATSFVLAHPGDDLNALAHQYGTVRLVSGLYPMTQPLVLDHPVTITADPGVTLLFAQGANAPTWTSAIKVRASHTTLDGFAVRFAGPVCWTDGVSYGPAVIGWSDNFDPHSNDPGIDLAFTHLDIQGPPASTSWEEAAHVFRLVGAESGSVAGNRFKGGTTELTGGPWQVTGNTYLGTMPDTFTYCAFGTHSTRDLTLSNNVVQPTGPSGKTWRFLVMTQGGAGDVVANNTVVGVGPMDTDTMPSPNASEVILTEAYTVHYEGQVSSVSADGLTVQIPSPQGGQARTGDVLAVLSGPQAGQWRTIAQVLNASTYVLDAPITPGRFAVSLVTGFVNETFQGNTEDCRGSTTAGDLVLVGNQFGVKVLDNTFLGGNDGFKITACPSESPVTWGWTHAPFLGATIAGNTFQDTLHGGLLDVEHNAHATSDAGRVYFSGAFSNNHGVWTAPFLAAQAAAGHSLSPTLVTIGDPLSVDPGELMLNASGNLVDGPPGVVSGQTFQVVSAAVNGLPIRNIGYVLPAFGSSVQTAGTTSPTPPPVVVVPPLVVPRVVAPVVKPPVSQVVAPVAKPSAPKVVALSPTPKPKTVAGVTATRKVTPTKPITGATHPAGPVQAVKPVVRTTKPVPTPVRFWPGLFRVSGLFGKVSA